MSRERVILITGTSGQVGGALLERLAPAGIVLHPDRKTLDLGSKDSIRNFVRSHKPAVIINAAAYTAVDKAESEPELATQVNAVAPAVLAEEAKRLQSLFITFSTDYVFDGGKQSPYVEDDACNPLNIYGRTKLEGEIAVQQVGGAVFIFRTSWVYGRTGQNFLKTMLRLARHGREVKIVNDQFGCPTTSDLIADATVHFLRHITQEGSDFDCWLEDSGIYHVVSSGWISWFGFAQAIFGQLAARGMQISPFVSCTSNQYPTAAVRPAYGVLDNRKFATRYTFEFPPWQECLTRLLQSWKLP
jgi:dTDP-4-dehydrorhamnose reductase